MLPSSRFLLVLALTALVFTGCTDSNPVAPVDETAPADVDPTTLETLPPANTAHGEVRGVYTTDVGDRMQPTRRIQASIVFKVRSVPTATRAADAATARGRFEYEDNWGDRFTASIQYARFTDSEATFWGPITRSTSASSVLDAESTRNWIFVRVYDDEQRNGRDRLTFQIGPPHPEPDTRLPDDEGTNLKLERGDIVVSGSALNVLHRF